MSRRFKLASLTRLRAWAESLMTDRLRISRYTGETDVDPVTGVATPRLQVVYEGKGKLQTSGGIAADKAHTITIGGEVMEWTLYLHLPVTVTGLREKDMVECIASADPALVGREYRLVNMQSEKTHATARRWNIKEIPKDA